MNRPVTNHGLADLLAEAAYDRSHAAFARQVNQTGADRYGLKLRYDGTSVYWWLRGRRPEQPAPELIAQVLSHRLQRPVPVAALGFGDIASADEALTFPKTAPEAVETAASLWRGMGAQARSGGTVPFIAAAAAEAGWRWHFDPADGSLARLAARKVTAGDIEALRTCADQFMDLDRHHGGGHARTFLADFLARDVTPLLRGSYTDSVGRDLFSAAAELTGMAAFMSYDICDHGSAQRAFIQALRLSKAAGDRTYGAHILANMATQAIYLDLPDEAVRLARAAVDGAGRKTDASITACLATIEANAHALAADERQYRAAYRRAERALDRMDGGGPRWARYFTPAHLAGTAMRSLLDLDRPAQALSYESIVMQVRSGNSRTLALHTALTATAHACVGNIDQAADLAGQALDLARRIRSRRVTARIDLLKQVLSPHRPVREVADFLDRARTEATTA